MSANYPPGTTQGMITALCQDDDTADMHHAHEEECALCHEVLVYDSSRNRWFKQEDVEIYGFRWMADDAAVKAFKTRMGWICSPTCWDECAVKVEQPKLFLVKAGAA